MFKLEMKVNGQPVNIGNSAQYKTRKNGDGVIFMETYDPYVDEQEGEWRDVTEPKKELSE